MSNTTECKRWILMAPNKYKVDVGNFVDYLQKAAGNNDFSLADPTL